MTAEPTGPVNQVAARTIQRYGPEDSAPTHAISLRADYLRTNVEMLRSDVVELHDEARSMDLDAKTRSMGRLSVGDLLSRLTEDDGMSWSDVATYVGVSVAAVRKWRQGSTATAENRARLARIAAFLDQLREKATVSDPAQWLDMPLTLKNGSTIRPAELFARGLSSALIEIADGRRAPEAVLDECWPEWRNETRSEFVVSVGADGEPVISRRES